MIGGTGMWRTAALALAVSCVCLTGSAVGRKVMNIVNFVRGSEPRMEMDLLMPLEKEIELNTRYGLDNTILLQYDALLRDDLVNAAKKADPARTEYGLWFEMCRQLVERVGIPWRGRKGWDWEWLVNPGFLLAYEPSERERIIDEAFRLFKERFGDYPRVAGSWVLDAHSMAYMSEKYGMDAFCICREQDNTDAYGLRGGYFNGAYYPSKSNALSAAVDRKNAIPVPVFRMLTPDPIYNYGPGHRIRRMRPGVRTLEPVSWSGRDRRSVDWFFHTYTSDVNLGLSYMQAGQENSFGWPEIEKGLPYQIERIAALSAGGKLTVETLGATGRRFKADCDANVPQAQVALENWNSDNYKSIWFNSRHYRANLFFEEGRLYFRDIHVFRDDYRETYLTQPCRRWFADYFTPPVVDAQLYSDAENSGLLEIGGTYETVSVTSPDDRTLIVSARRQDGTVATIAFSENRIDYDAGTEKWPGTHLTMKTKPCPFFSEMDFPPGRIEMSFDGFRYSIGYEGDLKPSRKGWLIIAVKGRSALVMEEEK